MLIDLDFSHVCITMFRESYLTCGLLLEMTSLYVNLGSLVRGYPGQACKPYWP